MIRYMGFYDDLNGIIGNYLNQENTDYALFLYGEWGSGKTYYATGALNKYVKVEYPKEKKFNGKKYELLPISLNGISSVDALRRKMFYRIMGKGSNDISLGLLDTFTSLASSIPQVGDVLGALAGEGKRLVQSLQEEKIKKELEYESLKNKYFVFDDLERISDDGNIKEILGYLFDDFISRGIKVLVIGNNQEVEKTWVDFKDTKEKLFQREVHFSPSGKELCESVINRFFSESGCKGFLLDNSVIINNVFETGGKNLRSIIFALRSFLYILEATESIEEEIRESHKTQLLLCVLAQSMEYKRGSLIGNNGMTTKDYIDIINLNRQSRGSSQHTQNMLQQTDNKNESTELSAEQQYCNRYGGFDVQLFYFVSTMEYIRTGVLNLEKFKEDIKHIFPENLPEHERVYYEIVDHLYKIEQAELIENTNAVVDALKRGKYNLILLPDIYISLCTLKRSLRNDWQHGDVTGIMIASARATRIGHAEKPMLFNNIMPHIDILRNKCKDEDKPGFNRVVNVIEEIMTRKQKDQHMHTLQAFLEKINTPRDQISDNEIWELCSKLKIDRCNFFHDIVESANLEKITALSNHGIFWISRILNDPIVLNNTNKNPHVEKQALEKIKEAVTHALQEAKEGERNWDNLRITRYRELVENIDRVILHLENKNNPGLQA